MAMRSIDFINRLLFFSLPVTTSLQCAAVRCGADYAVTNDPNSNEFVASIKENNIDLIVSFSAPVVFRTALLEAPTHGCINLHCSLLPRYAGLLPSFWTLYEGESVFGATVHMMDSKIDNGAILGQVSIDLSDRRSSMFSVIKATKAVGGQLMKDVVGQIAAGTVDLKPNKASDSDYRGWPDVSDMRAFRKRGGRLI